MPQDLVDKGLFRKKPTYSEILSSIERDEDKIELPERTALAFWDSFAMGQYKQLLETAAAGTQAEGGKIRGEGVGPFWSFWQFWFILGHPTVNLNSF